MSSAATSSIAPLPQSAAARKVAKKSTTPTTSSTSTSRRKQQALDDASNDAPIKTELELIQEQLNAAIADLNPASAASAASSSSPPALPATATPLWSLSLSDINSFCFPSSLQHSPSRGLLVLLALHGPLLRVHSWMNCLCRECKLRVKDGRKDSEYWKRVYGGELFTKENLAGKKQRIGRKQQNVAAAAESQDHSSLAATSSTATAPLSPLAATQLLPSLSLSTSSTDHLPPLCSSCTSHITSCGHLLGGTRSHPCVLSSLQLNELAARIEQEDILRAYNRWMKLSKEEEREFIGKLEKEKREKMQMNYTREEIEKMLEKVPRLKPEQYRSEEVKQHQQEVTENIAADSSSSDSTTARMDFYAFQSVILQERTLRIQRLSEMYPDVTSPTPASNTAVASASSPTSHKHVDTEEEKESPPAPLGLKWEGESLLTTSMLARQYPPHQTYAVRTRLLHKHSHDVVDLGSGLMNHPSVQLSVALMRNQHKTDKTEGWKTHF